MNYIKSKAIAYFNLIIILAFIHITPTSPLYADDSNHFRIREMSSKRNERLFNKIAIDLLNGKSRYIPLDNMVKILKNYRVVEFSSEEMKPAQDIILKEVAFRMLKQHYLPRIGDKIRIYKLKQEFLKDAGIHPGYGNTSDTAIGLPLETADIADRNELKTIYWNDLVMQVSNVIEKLWIRRINCFNRTSASLSNESSLLEASLLLRKKFIQQDKEELQPEKSRVANAIVWAVEDKIGEWFREGLISEADKPVLVEMIIQYIILSSPMDTSHIIAELRGLKDAESLKNILLDRVKGATETVKSHNPTDYAAFAMLQSLLDAASSHLFNISNTLTDKPRGFNMDPRESRHSA